MTKSDYSWPNAKPAASRSYLAHQGTITIEMIPEPRGSYFRLFDVNSKLHTYPSSHRHIRLTRGMTRNLPALLREGRYSVILKRPQLHCPDSCGDGTEAERPRHSDKAATDEEVDAYSKRRCTDPIIGTFSTPRLIFICDNTRC